MFFALSYLHGKEGGKRENLSDFSMTFSHCLSKGNYFIKQSENVAQLTDNML